MNINDESKVIWIVSVDVWEGKVLNIQIKVIDKNLSIGSYGNGDGTADVCLYPSKIDYEECRYDNKKVIERIKKSNFYKMNILKYVYGVTTLKF